MDKLLQTYLRRLVNLSGTNRSLLLLRLASEQFIDIHDFNFLEKQSSFSILEKIIARKKKIPICKQVDSRDDQANEVSRKLKRLKRIDKLIFEERGSKDLYVGWPFIRGKFSDGTLVRCPLVFFPVSIEIENNEWVISLRGDVNITFNKSFLLGYSYFNQVKLDEDLIERTFDDYDPDSTVFRTEIYQTFRDSPVDINFNSDNFTDSLVSFKNFKKADFEKDEQNGELKLFPEAVLGIFPQAGSQLVPDYLDMIDNMEQSDLEEFFVKRTLSQDKDQLHFPFVEVIREEDTYTPFKMDGFQEKALKNVKMGNSLVIQGPPGTGKSQLICNLISDFMARGKTVLVVSQKRAALDVVFDRIKEAGFSQFLALVHDFKNDRKKLYEEIAFQVDRLNEYESQNNSLDIVKLERSFQQASRRIDQINEELEEFKFALFDQSECGVSAKELYLTSNKQDATINLKLEYKNFKFDVLPDFEIRFTNYIDLQKRFGHGHLWNERKSFAGFSLKDLKRMEEILGEIPARREELEEVSAEILGKSIEFEELQGLETIKEELEFIIKEIKDKEIFNKFQIASEYSDQEVELLWISNIERIIIDCFVGDGIEVSLKGEELGHFQEVLQRRLRARKNPFKYLYWSIFSKEKYYLKRVVVANGLSPNSQGLKTLVRKIDNRLNLEHNLTKLKEKEWLGVIPDSLTKVGFQTWFEVVKRGAKVKKSFGSIRLLNDNLSPAKISQSALLKKLNKLVKLSDEYSIMRASWETYLSDQQIKKIFKDEVKINQLSKSLNKDFDNLCELDQLIEDLTSEEESVIKKAMEVSEDKESNPWKIFDNSLKLAWIDHIESKYPILRSVSSIKFRKLEKELQTKVKEKVEVSNEMLKLRLRERTYQNIHYNRLKNRVTYRDLNHQVTKKKRIWPIRKLISQHSEDLFNLKPCWLASPESVSAIFPMLQLFDLVVFDEASQTFTEHSIPAMYRGRQIVVAGDNKQLRPNDLYKIRWEDESEDPSIEVDSLLELASQYLMNIMLEGHYRSKTLDLIDFSNKNFYSGRLKLLPDRKLLALNKPALHYTKVDGIWDDNKNTVEAKEVVKLVFDLLKSSPKKDIGIVTFNARQQMHIIDELEEEAMREKMILPEKLFVKNIENVQGDERDIIIFSTAYGPNPKGKIVLQFGSLNAEGGENRLNVAVTRAREEVYIISSIMPQQLRTDSTKNLGPKLLKKYLEYALQVSEGKFVPATPEPANREEWYLREKLKSIVNELESGAEISNEMPFADLTVRVKGEPRGLILTDDDLYHESISIKQMHVYKPFSLSSKNWKFAGVFSRQYWDNPDEVKDNLRLFIHKQNEK